MESKLTHAKRKNPYEINSFERTLAIDRIVYYQSGISDENRVSEEKQRPIILRFIMMIKIDMWPKWLCENKFLQCDKCLYASLTTESNDSPKKTVAHHETKRFVAITCVVWITTINRRIEFIVDQHHMGKWKHIRTTAVAVAVASTRARHTRKAIDWNKNERWTYLPK